MVLLLAGYIAPRALLLLEVQNGANAKEVAQKHGVSERLAQQDYNRATVLDVKTQIWAVSKACRSWPCCSAR